MGVDKKIQMNEFNGADYDKLYPKTTFDMVVSDTSENPTTLSQAIDGVVGDIKLTARESIGDDWAKCDGFAINHNKSSQSALWSAMGDMNDGGFGKITNTQYTMANPIFVSHPGRTIFYKNSTIANNYDIGVLSEDGTFTEFTSRSFTSTTGNLLGFTMADANTYIACFITTGSGTNAVFYSSVDLITWVQAGTVKISDSGYTPTGIKFFAKDNVGYRILFVTSNSTLVAEISSSYSLIDEVYTLSYTNTTIVYFGDIFAWIAGGSTKYIHYAKAGSNTMKSKSLPDGFYGELCQMGNSTTYFTIPYASGSEAFSGIYKLIFSEDYSSVNIAVGASISTIKPGTEYFAYCGEDENNNRIVQFANNSAPYDVWQSRISQESDMTVSDNYIGWERVSAASIKSIFGTPSCIGMVIGPQGEMSLSNIDGTYISASYIKAAPNIQNDDYNAFIKIS